MKIRKSLLFGYSGTLAISIAAVEDIVVWVIVAIATSLSKGEASIEGLYTVLLAIAFLILMFIDIHCCIID